MAEYNPKSYDAVLARIESKLDLIIGEQQKLNSKQEVIENRVQSLENRWNVVVGVAIVISSVVTFLLKYIF